MVNKDNVRALFEKPKAGQAAEAKAEVVSPALGPGAGCLSSKQILRAMVLGITDNEREHVLNCLSCLEHLRHIDKVSFRSGSNFVQRMLAKLEPKKRAEAAAAAVGYAAASPWGIATCTLPWKMPLEQGAFHAIFATLSRLQKLNPVSPPGQVFKVELVPLFVLEPFRFDKGSFELQGALRTSTIEAIEKIDVNKDGKSDFIRLTFSNLKPSRQIAEAISAKRTIYDTVRLVGQVQDVHKKKFDIVAQASLEFKGK